MLHIDDDVTILAYPEEMMGRKEKYKVLINGRDYILKFGGTYYEPYAELIAEEIGLQLGIEMAHYELCQYKEKKGLLTPVFLDNDGDELIISSRSLSEASQRICEENNIKDSLKENAIENIVQAAYLFDKRINKKELFMELVKRWMFYGLIMESDKNNTNISFITNNKKSLRLSPDYDNSTMSRMNEDIGKFIDGLKYGNDIYSLTDGIKLSLKLYENDPDQFLPAYISFVNNNYDTTKDIVEQFRNISVDDAIESVELLNNIEIPWEVKYWLNKSINSRKIDMLRALDDRKVKVKK